MKIREFTRRYQNALILAGILLIAAFLRFYLLKTVPPGLYPDEAVNGNDAATALAKGSFQVFYPQNNGREGFFLFLQGISLWVFHQHAAWVLRVPSAALGTLTVWGFYLLLKELAGQSKVKYAEALALAGSFFLATSAWHVLFSRNGFRVISAPFVAVFAVYFLLRALRNRSVGWAAAGGLAMGLGLYTYTSYRLMPLLLLAVLPLWWKEKKRSRLAGSYVLAFVLTLLPLAAYFIANPDQLWGHSEQVSVFSQANPWGEVMNNIILTGKMILIQGDSNWRHNIDSNPEIFWPVAVCLIIGLAVAAVRRSLFDRLMALWLVLALIPVIFSDQAMPHALRSLLMIPSFLAFAASGAVWLYENLLAAVSLRGRWMAALFLGVFVFLNTFLAYFGYWAGRPEVSYAYTEKYADIASQINALPAGISKNVVLWNSDLSLCYLPICVQSVMFLTDTFTPAKQREKHVYYWMKEDYLDKAKEITGPVFFMN